MHKSGTMRHELKLFARADGEAGARGPYLESFVTRAAIKSLNAAKMAEAGLAESGSRIFVRVRMGVLNNTIGTHMRATLRGPGMAESRAALPPYEVESVTAPDPINRTIDIILVEKMGG